MDDIGSGISSLAVFGFLAFLIWHGSREKLEKRRLRMEEQSRILDRIGSGPELAEFLKSDEGKRFLDGLERAEKDASRTNGFKIGVIALVTAAVIAGCLAGTFFVLAEIVESQSEVEGFIISGVILTGVGVACLLAAFLQYLFGKRWGMLGPGAGNEHRYRESERPRRTLE